jgi:hypothetical protein
MLVRLVGGRSENQLREVMSAGYETVMRNRITSSRKAGFEGPSIDRPTGELLGLVSAGASDQDLMATLMAHLNEYRFLISWLTSWERAALPEEARRNDVYPVNAKLMQKIRT